MSRLGFAAALVIATLGFEPRTLAQQPIAPPVATFKSSIDLVRLSAVVRDKKGRFVPDLTAQDFEVFDGGLRRVITDFRHGQASLSIAMLFDVSGSMEARMASARAAAVQVLSWLKEDDETAVFTFDTRLDEVMPFTTDMTALPSELSSVQPFGATSLHDAIAATAEKVAGRESLRRAVVVFTDGRDTSSRLTSGQVSGIASAIDVPVYIIGIVSAIDNPSADISATTVEQSALAGPLSNLAYWTGGDVFIVSTIVERSLMARQLVAELRHQYLIAFESSSTPGWHPLVVRMRGKDLTVRARSGYIAGRSRPNSH